MIKKRVIRSSFFIPVNNLTTQGFTRWTSASSFRAESQGQVKEESNGYTIFQNYPTDLKEEQKESKAVDNFSKKVR